MQHFTRDAQTDSYTIDGTPATPQEVKAAEDRLATAMTVSPIRSGKFTVTTMQQQIEEWGEDDLPTRWSWGTHVSDYRTNDHLEGLWMQRADGWTQVLGTAQFNLWSSTKTNRRAAIDAVMTPAARQEWNEAASRGERPDLLSFYADLPRA